MRKKLAILGSAGIPARYGGFETYAENLSLGLTNEMDVVVYCSTKYYMRNERGTNWNGVHRIFIPFHANGVSSLLYDSLSLLHAFRKADYILLLGSGNTLIISLLKIFYKKTLLIHIDGLDWKRKKWNRLVRYYIKINTLWALRLARYILIDNSALSNHLPEKFSFKFVSTCYGSSAINPSSESTSGIRPYVLIIARAEPENNIRMILETFEELNSFECIAVSNWQFTKYGKCTYKRYKNHRVIRLKGPIYEDSHELNLLRSHCVFYIHGHSSGGTNPSLVEAMYAGIPILAFDNEFNRITTQNLAYYFKTKDELKHFIIHADKYLKSHNAIRMKNYAEKYYTWDAACETIKKLIL